MSIGNHTLPTEALDTCTNGFLYCFSQWASDVTVGSFWVMAIISFSFIIFLATLRYGSNRAFGFAGFVLMMGSVWLAILTLIPWWIASAFIIIGLISLVVLLISQEE